MSEVEALRNTFSAIQGLRALHHGAAREIELVGEGKARAVIAFGHWSKSAVDNNSQVVFLILEGALLDEQIAAAQVVQYGAELWKITGWKSPAELKKAYWLLTVKLGGTDGK